MIYTITLTPYIEKRIYGKYYDELRFDAEAFRYNVSGCGIKTSKYLKKMGIDSTCAYICSYKEVSFMQEELTKRNIETIVLETNTTTPYEYCFMDEKEEVKRQKENPQYINDTQCMLFSSVLKDCIKDNVTIALEYNDIALSQKAMTSLYQTLIKKSELILCDVHPKYYVSLTSRKADVLFVDENNLSIYLDHMCLPFSERIHAIKKELTPLAKVLVYMYAPNDFIIFYNNHVYRALSMVKLPSKTIYKEAIFSAVLNCLEKDDSFEDMCRMIVKYSCGATISEGLYMSSALMEEKIEETIHVYPL